jgi:hypothetical protein
MILERFKCPEKDQVRVCAIWRATHHARARHDELSSRGRQFTGRNAAT